VKRPGPAGRPPPGPAMLVPEFCYLTGEYFENPLKWFEEWRFLSCDVSGCTAFFFSHPHLLILFNT